MLEIKCPACGGTMRLEEGRLLRACPYCGAELSREAAARGWEIPGPSELEKKLAKENNPKKKYKLILAALEKDPALQKIENDRKQAKPMPAEVREKLQKIRRGL